MTRRVIDETYPSGRTNDQPTCRRRTGSFAALAVSDATHRRRRPQLHTPTAAGRWGRTALAVSDRVGMERRRRQTAVLHFVGAR